MRIECPTCSAVYDLPERLLSGGSRMLRCAACGNTWSVNPAPEEPAAVPEPAPAAIPAPRVPARQEPLSNDRDFAALMEAVAGVSRGDKAEEPMAGPAEAHPEDAAAMAEQTGAAGHPEPETEQQPAGIPPAAVVARPSAAPARPSFGLTLAWVATLGGLGALVLAFALYPEEVVTRWPAAARLYEAVGISLGAS